MTAESIITNFLHQYRKPYSIDIMSSITGIHPSALASPHRSAIKNGMVKEIEPGIFVSIVSRPQSISVSDWNYDIAMARHIISLLAAKPSGSSRDLALRIHRSHEYACRYLTALMSIDAVIISPAGYIPGPNSILDNFGSCIVPGIISKSRKIAKQKQRGKK